MKKICLAWWWTWWHITPLLSLYKSINKEEFNFFWIGENNSLEQKIAKENNINFYSIKAWKLRRYFSLKTLIEPFMVFIGIIESYRILKKENPDLVFSKGWYVSLPIAIASKIIWIRLFLHESDTIPWLANRLVGKFASKIFLWFKEASKFFQEDKIEVVWQLLNPDLFNKEAILKNNDTIEKESNKTELLVIAWSQWSTRIFEVIEKNIDKLNNFQITIILGTLNSHFWEKFAKYSNVETFEFINQQKLWEIYKKTDIAITRAWATSLAELEAFGIRMIIVPLTESANNHQHYNALSYTEEGNVLVTDLDLQEKLIAEIIKFKNYKKNISWEITNWWLEKIIRWL